MRIRAHVAKANNTTIASSIDSLRWCGESMRAGREIVIIQFRPMPGRSRFPGPAKRSGNKRLSTSLLNKTGTADMQLIFELIWNQSRSRFLATIGEREAGQ